MKTEESMKKIREMMVVFVGILCMTGCGNTEESFPSATGIAQEEATKTTQETEIQEETGVVKEDEAQQEDAVEMMNPAVLAGGALPFTNMTIVQSINHPDASYYYEDMTEDGFVSVINCSYASTREDGESSEDYALRAATSQSLYETENVTVEKNDTYSENIGYPVYVVKFSVGQAEDTSYWNVFVTEAKGYTYVYAVYVWSDAYDGMEEIIQDLFGRLLLIETEPLEQNTASAEGLSIDDIRDIAAANGDICAAMFLGYATDIDSYLTENDLSDYPFLAEIPRENYVEEPDGGMEIYCIIPADPTASVAVNEWIMDESNGYYGETGQVLYRSESGEPILLRANPSDAMPGTQVVIVDGDGQVLDWNPSLSLYDGSMNTPWYSPGVCDMTDYNSQPFFGWWSAITEDGSEISMNLNFQRPGYHMSYSYGYGNSELLAAYVGTWSVDDEAEKDGVMRVTFSMTNVDDPADEFWGVYSIQLVDETHIDIVHEDGRALYDGLEHAAYTFEWDSY